MKTGIISKDAFIEKLLSLEKGGRAISVLESALRHTRELAKRKIKVSWEEVDDKHKRKYDRDFVSCEEYYERKFVIAAILQHFHYSRAMVEAAVVHCCKTIPAPRPRKTFLQCIAKKLGDEYI